MCNLVFLAGKNQGYCFGERYGGFVLRPSKFLRTSQSRKPRLKGSEVKPKSVPFYSSVTLHLCNSYISWMFCEFFYSIWSVWYLKHF